MGENFIIKTYKKMLESMPVEETAKMFMYKLAKSEQCREYELCALILLLQKMGFCRDEFYNDKLLEYLKDNSEEVYDLFYELSIPAPEGGDCVEIDT